MHRTHAGNSSELQGNMVPHSPRSPLPFTSNFGNFSINRVLRTSWAEFQEPTVVGFAHSKRLACFITLNVDSIPQGNRYDQTHLNHWSHSGWGRGHSFPTRYADTELLLFRFSPKHLWYWYSPRSHSVLAHFQPAYKLMTTSSRRFIKPSQVFCL